MFNYSKDGVVVSTVLDARTINKEGKYPVKNQGLLSEEAKILFHWYLYDKRRME